MGWYEEDDQYVAQWLQYSYTDQWIQKQLGEPPSYYDHTVQLCDGQGNPGYDPPPGWYLTFRTWIFANREKCCTLLTTQ